MKRQSVDLAVLCNLIVAIYLNENFKFFIVSFKDSMDMLSA